MIDSYGDDYVTVCLQSCLLLLVVAGLQGPNVSSAAPLPHRLAAPPGRVCLADPSSSQSGAGVAQQRARGDGGGLVRRSG